MATLARRVLSDVFAGVLPIEHIIGTHDHEDLARAWRNVNADNGNVLACGKIERGCNGSAIHWINDKSLGALLNQRMDIGDLLGGIVISDEGTNERGVVLRSE